MEQKIKVQIEYESEILPLGEINDYQTLCQQIESKIVGILEQNLITYLTPSGMVVNVNNDSTFNAARDEMKPELKFTCTPKSNPATTAPIATPVQDVLREDFLSQIDSLQRYFPMNAKKQTLYDFNCVHSRYDPIERKSHIEELKSEPEELTLFIIYSLFGFLLSQEEMSNIQSELEYQIQGLTISVRFLVSFLLQSADFGLRVRLNNYFCKQKSVPLIMNCQQTFKDSKLMNYNQELIFSISDEEGVGVFAFGVGKHATNPCGKSEISNLIVTPNFDNKSFDVQDLNVFSNGQIDVFFEKCYQKKSGWAFMDGQGKIQEQSLLSVLPLTNIVLIHFFQKDQNDQKSVAELVETINLIKDSDATIQVCLILRDCNETKEVLKSDKQDWLLCREKVDKLIELINVSYETRLVQKSNFINKLMLYFNESVRKIQSLKNIKFTKKNFLNGFCKMDHYREDTFKRIADIIKLSENFIREVQNIEIFSQQYLPSLKIKDQIHEVSLKIRSFEFLNGDNMISGQALDEYHQLKIKLKKLTHELSNLEVNPLMEQFLQISQHLDTVEMKLELSKNLQKFTLENIKNIVSERNDLISTHNEVLKKCDLYESQEERFQNFLDQYNLKLKEINDKILQRSLSYEDFWQSMTFSMGNNKQIGY